MQFPKNHYLKKHKDLVKLMCDFFTMPVNNPTEYENLKTALKEDAVGLLDTNHIVYLDLGFLSKRNFMHWLTLTPRHVTADDNAIDKALIAFREIGLLGVYYSALHHKDFQYFVENRYLAALLKDRDLLFNRLFGFEYIAEKYKKSVFKIENTKNDDPAIGNGFLIAIGGRQFILTNFHVVNGADKLRLLTHDDKPIGFTIEKLDEKLDLALLLLSENQDAVPFRTWVGMSALNDVLTIGYPPVACSSDAHALFHLGEINSEIEDYRGRSLFLFSAKTNPGNSGSPVIGVDGRVLGIVTDQLEEVKGYEKGKTPYFAAIPAVVFERFLGVSSAPKNEFPWLAL